MIHALETNGSILQPDDLEILDTVQPEDAWNLRDLRLSVGLT